MNNLANQFPDELIKAIGNRGVLLNESETEELEKLRKK